MIATVFSAVHVFEFCLDNIEFYILFVFELCTFNFELIPFV